MILDTNARVNMRLQIFFKIYFTVVIYFRSAGEHIPEHGAND